MKNKSITKNYIYNLTYQVLVLILPLFTTPYISRILGAENIGIYSYTLSITTYFILFGSLGISMYAQREIAIYDKEIKESVNTKVGVIDVMQEFPDLAEDYATTDIEKVKHFIKERLNLPKEKADILILAGGGHEKFARYSGIKYEENTLYNDSASPIMMDIETRKKETERYYKSISLDEIRQRVKDPDWWYATRAMSAFALVVAEAIGAKYIVPTDIAMVYGILEKGENMLKDKKVIIFDMDGTLIDSIGIWNKTDEILIGKLTNNTEIQVSNIQQIRDGILAKCKSDDIYLEYCDCLRRKYNSDMSAKEILDLRWNISDDYIKNQIDYKPNADKLLHILKDMGYILALATTTTNIQLNAYRNFNWNIKEKANIDEMFEIILSKEDVKDKKPSPEVHNKIMQVLNVSPSECLIIEDSLIGVQAAKNAGIEVAVIYDKYSDCDREEINKIVQYQFKDFDEMLNYIKNELGD